MNETQLNFILNDQLLAKICPNKQRFSSFGMRQMSVCSAFCVKVGSKYENYSIPLAGDQPFLGGEFYLGGIAPP